MTLHPFGSRPQPAEVVQIASARDCQMSGVAGLVEVLDDLIMVLVANSGIRTPSSAAAVAASRRFAALLIQGMRAEPKIPPLHPAVPLPLAVVA